MPLTTSIDDLFTTASAAPSIASEDGTPAVLYTGRYIAIFKDDAPDTAAADLQSTYNVSVASAATFEDQAVDFSDLGDAEVLVFPNLGVALVSAEAYASINPGSDGTAIASTDTTTTPAVPSTGFIASFEREVFVFVPEPAFDSTDPANAADPTNAAIIADAGTTPDAGTTTTGASTTAATSVTWGLDLTAVSRSNFSGNGIKLCVLDTGFDLTHPEFAGRTIVSKSFVGQPVQDGNSHGTHTAGTACGPLAPGTGIPRYSVAYGAQMYIGKVMTDKGVGVTAAILAGINWALANKCEVVSMSIRAQTPVLDTYTKAGTKALAQGSLLVAAAGNDSKRPGTIAKTGSPANSPTFMAVAALDKTLAIASFSNGGKVEIAGPGVNVFSSVPVPALHGIMDGTSMATPHVAGIAALWAESDSTLRGQTLWTALINAAKPVGADPSDVGAGMVQAPTGPGMSK